jgi:putative tryptophan/tyrosine transport system substrate-binding protein
MRRREFAIGLLLAAAARPAQAQQSVKQRRIAIIRGAGPAATMKDTGDRFWHGFFGELKRLGEIEGQNLTVERYSGEGHTERYADVARRAVESGPDLIVALGDTIARAAREAEDTMPIVWIGAEPIEAQLAKSVARPLGNVTGVTVYPTAEIWGKRLQILKEAVPLASKIAYLDVRSQLSATGQKERRKASQQLQFSLINVLLEDATPSELERVFVKIAQERPDAMMVSGSGDLLGDIGFAVPNETRYDPADVGARQRKAAPLGAIENDRLRRRYM